MFDPVNYILNTRAVKAARAEAKRLDALVNDQMAKLDDNDLQDHVVEVDGKTYVVKVALKDARMPLDESAKLATLNDMLSSGTATPESILEALKAKEENGTRLSITVRERKTK
jgi:hypothetical protein